MFLQFASNQRLKIIAVLYISGLFFLNVIFVEILILKVYIKNEECLF